MEMLEVWDVPGLEDLPPTFTPAEAVAVGMPRHDVYVLAAAGEIVAISRGVYRKASAPETAHVDLIAATKRAPRAIVCLVSALAVNELTDEIPREVQLAVPRAVNAPRITHPPVRVSRFDAATFDLGRVMFEVAPGERIPVYGPERAVADAMRLRHVVGDTIALRALRVYLARPKVEPGSLMAMGRQLGDATALLRAIQVVLA